MVKEFSKEFFLKQKKRNLIKHVYFGTFGSRVFNVKRLVYELFRFFGGLWLMATNRNYVLEEPMAFFSERMGQIPHIFLGYNYLLC